MLQGGRQNSIKLIRSLLQLEKAYFNSKKSKTWVLWGDTATGTSARGAFSQQRRKREKNGRPKSRIYSAEKPNTLFCV